MVEVLIIADDLTGAIDAAAPFIGMSVRVKIDYSAPLTLNDFASGARVLAVNANSRHLDAADARARVKELVASAEAAGVSVIIKKTDSVLRGNIGAELEGALCASTQSVLHFLPSFPAMDRITVGGVHYIEGVPVAESKLANDPFDPVCNSNVCDILAETTQVPSMSVDKAMEPDTEFEGIAVYDAVTDEALADRVSTLLAGASRAKTTLLLAGCAGVSTAVAAAMSETANKKETVVSGQGSLLVFCGSVNPVSIGQVAYARKNDAPIVTIAPAQILDTSWLDSSEFNKLMCQISQKLNENKVVVVDNSSKVPKTDMAAVGIATTDELRSYYAESLGKLASAMLLALQVDNMLVMGGDVLLSMLTCLEIKECTLAAQIAPGVVVFEVELSGRKVHLISKSGGFGEPDMFVKMAESLSANTSNKATALSSQNTNEQIKEIA